MVSITIKNIRHLACAVREQAGRQKPKHEQKIIRLLENESLGRESTRWSTTIARETRQHGHGRASVGDGFRTFRSDEIADNLICRRWTANRALEILDRTSASRFCGEGRLERRRTSTTNPPLDHRRRNSPTVRRSHGSRTQRHLVNGAPRDLRIVAWTGPPHSSSAAEKPAQSARHAYCGRRPLIAAISSPTRKRDTGNRKHYERIRVCEPRTGSGVTDRGAPSDGNGDAQPPARR